MTTSEHTRSGPAGSVPSRRRSGSPEEIARLLTAYVTTGDLRPGARIPSERRLAEELGVGRTVVREALKSLALVGLIESRHGDGTYVADSTPESFSRAVEWRLVAWGGERGDVAEAIAVLEGDLAALAAERRTDADLLELHFHLAAERESANPTDLDAAHLAFRATTAVAAGNVTLASVVEALRAAAPIVAAAEVTTIDPAADALVLDAITRRNPDDARRSSRAGRNLTSEDGDERN
ncbi:MAG TPA: GntR family transcriptional regulator [Verrucomicrobiae bacterium]|nr:GntR family transcriptional regulator [Verrucomicrobiae bacterium]